MIEWGRTCVLLLRLAFCTAFRLIMNGRMVSLITMLQFLLDAVFSWVNATLFWFSPFSLAFMLILMWLKMSCSS